MDDMNITNNPLTNLRQQIHKHWAKYRPSMFAEMQANGTLNEQIDHAARLTEEAVLDYAPEGMSPAQAFLVGWELYRNEWAFLPAEDGLFDNEAEDDPETAAYRKRLRRMAAEQTVSDIWDEQNERWLTPFVWDEEKEELVPTGAWDDTTEEWTPAEGYENWFPPDPEIEASDDEGVTP